MYIKHTYVCDTHTQNVYIFYVDIYVVIFICICVNLNIITCANISTYPIHGLVAQIKIFHKATEKITDNGTHL